MKIVRKKGRINLFVPIPNCMCLVKNNICSGFTTNIETLSFPNMHNTYGVQSLLWRLYSGEGRLR